jgi:hypothetical protein
MRKTIGLLGLVCLFSAPAAAMNTLQTKSLSVHVGGSATVGTFAQHKKDCSPLGGGTINVTRSPTLGRVATTENSPVVTRFSISGSCIGTKQFGTRVDYLATAPGVDKFEFDVVFMNGTLHYAVTANNH